MTLNRQYITFCLHFGNAFKDLVNEVEASGKWQDFEQTMMHKNVRLKPSHPAKTAN